MDLIVTSEEILRSNSLHSCMVIMHCQVFIGTRNSTNTDACTTTFPEFIQAPGEQPCMQVILQFITFHHNMAYSYPCMQ